jgi:RNA polymerase sigma-70 factor (ECF subfamily)
MGVRMEAVSEAGISVDLPEPYTVTSPFDDLAAVHAAYEGRVFRFLLYSLRDRDLAMTITQDTFLAAWRYKDSFRGECSVVTWLMRIAVNQLRDHVRSRRFKFWKQTMETDIADLVEPAMDSSQSTERALVAREELQAVWERVEKLSDKQKTVFLLRFVDDLELTEIAAITGQPLPTVKSHLYRALDHVRELRNGLAKEPAGERKKSK